MDRTGWKTTWTAPSSWTRSETSSTSSPCSTAWPTSGSGVHVHVQADFTLIYQAHGPTSALRSKFLWEGSQRVGVSSNQDADLSYSAFIRPDGSVVFIVLNRYRSCAFRYVWDVSRFLHCCYRAGHHLRSRLRCGTPPWATSPPPLRLTRCSRWLGKLTDR